MKPGQFYEIHDLGDGTADVYLTPDIHTGARDITILAIKGVAVWPTMEADIRQRYESWVQSAQEITGS